MHAEKKHQVFLSVSATTTFLCVFSIAVAAVEKGYKYTFCFLVEVLLLLISFLVGCATAAADACAAYNISTEAERGTGYYCFFLLRFFCRLHCVRCFGCLLLLLFLAASVSVLLTAIILLWL